MRFYYLLLVASTCSVLVSIKSVLEIRTKIKTQMLELEAANTLEGIVKASLMQVRPIESFRTVNDLIDYVNASKGTLLGGSLTEQDKSIYLTNLIALLDAYLTNVSEQAKLSIAELERITGRKDVTTATIVGGISAAVAITLPVVGTLLGLAFAASNSFSKKQAVQIVSNNLERMKADVTRVLSLKEELKALAKKSGLPELSFVGNLKASTPILLVVAIVFLMLKS